MGEPMRQKLNAAGLAASLLIKLGVVPRELKVIELQDALSKDGVDLAILKKESQT